MTTHTITAEQAIERLLAGNQRYVTGAMQHPNQDAARRAEVVPGQHPIAAILSCSDSRVPVEVLFDQGIGDVFIVRTAGNIADDVALGSLEYAAEHLHVPVIVVLGHQKCGAIAATAAGGEAPGHIAALVKALAPAVEAVRGQAGDLIDNAVRANVKLIVAQLKACQPILAELVHAGHVKIVGARYDLESGAVAILG